MAALSKLASKALARIRSAAIRGNPRVRKALKRFDDAPELLNDLPPAVLQSLADGDVSALTAAVDLSPSSAGNASEAGWMIPAGVGAAAAGVVAGGAAARVEGDRQREAARRAAGPESLSDGLDGAPQSDLTPEPVAGTQSVPSREQPLDQSAGANEGGMPEGFESLPFDQMPQAYQDYINSLPENSPERKAARERRQGEADAGMANFQEGMDIATNAPMSREELARLRDGGNVWGPRPDAPLPLGVTRGPNHGTLSVKPSAANGWRSYAKPGVDYDPEEHDGTGMSDAEFQKWIESRGPGSDLHRRYDPRGYEAFDNERSMRAIEGNARDWNDRHHGEEQNSYWVEEGMLPTQYQTSGTRLVRDPVTGEAVNVPVNQPMASTPLKRYTLTEQGRKASKGVSATQASESGRVGNRKLDDMDRASIDSKLVGLSRRIARQTGRPPSEVLAELRENANVYQDPQTGAIGVRASDAARGSILDAQEEELARRKETVQNYNTRFRSRGPVAGREAARALTMLNSGTLSPEAARAAEYLINPLAASVDKAEAENEPRNDKTSEVSPLVQEQEIMLKEARLKKASEDGAAAARENKRQNPNDMIARDLARNKLKRDYPEGSDSQNAALGAFDLYWPPRGDPSLTPQGGPRGGGYPATPGGRGPMAGTQ